MPAVNLTETWLKKTLPKYRAELQPEKRIDVWDSQERGLGLRLSLGRANSAGERPLRAGWVFVYRPPGEASPRRKAIGTYPEWGLQEAREQARAWRGLVSKGEDPARVQLEQKRRKAEAAGNTFAAVRDEFLRKYRTRQGARPRPRYLEEIRRSLCSDLLRDWEPRPITEISRRDVLRALDAKIEAGHESAANTMRTHLKLLFGWAAERDYLPHGAPLPTDRIRRPGREQSRERTLSDHELRAIWNAASASVFGDIVRALALTGQRRTEVAGMRWAELDLAAGVWEIPRERSKNGTPHRVPLSRPLLEIIERRRQQSAGGLVFTVDGGLYSGWSRSKGRLDQRAGAADWPEGWRLHDLRRTMVTRMNEELNIPPHIVEACVNHVSGHKAGVAAVYNRADYLEQKRDAFDKWADHLLAIVVEEPAAELAAMAGGA